MGGAGGRWLSYWDLAKVEGVGTSVPIQVPNFPGPCSRDEQLYYCPSPQKFLICGPGGSFQGFHESPDS